LNWLAHIFLSESNIDFQIGNFLADPLKGKAWENANEEIKKGMFTHKQIDSFTDKHEIVTISKKRLREKGLLKPIIIDLTYDYFLTKNWDKFCNIPLKKFSNNFYHEAYKRTPFMPYQANLPISHMIERDLLNKYHTINQLKTSFSRMDGRLSPRLLQRDSASSYSKTVVENIHHLEKDFLEFFPQLCKTVKQDLDKDRLKHWRI
jgi:acyl carrier protein phosphodiesterase